MKKLLSLSIIVILFILITSCSTIEKEITDKNQSLELNKPSGFYDGDYDAVGRLVAERIGEIDLKIGNEIKTYKTNDDTSVYYLGEYIGVKQNGDIYNTSLYKEYDINKRYTEDGSLIYRVNGKVDDITEDEIIVTTDNGSMHIQNPGNFNISNGANAILDYIGTSEGNKLVSFYDTANVMVLMVENIKRDFEGKMIITASNALGMQYIIPVDSDVLMNITHSSMKTGDNIEVYFNFADDNDPPSISSTMILKQ